MEFLIIGIILVLIASKIQPSEWDNDEPIRTERVAKDEYDFEGPTSKSTLSESEVEIVRSLSSFRELGSDIWVRGGMTNLELEPPNCPRGDSQWQQWERDVAEYRRS